MLRKKYTDDFKINMMQEFNSREIEIAKFAAEKNIPLGTFKVWLENYRKFGTPIMKRPTLDATVKPIDVTSKTKEIMREAKSLDDQKFSLEINGISLTFALKNLKTVLEIIQNG